MPGPTNLVSYCFKLLGRRRNVVIWLSFQTCKAVFVGIKSPSVVLIGEKLVATVASFCAQATERLWATGGV
jgi:hypothetical protein